MSSIVWFSLCLAPLNFAQQPPSETSPNVSASDPQWITVTVENEQHDIIGGLGRDAFTLTGKSGPIDIGGFSADDQPADVVIVLDVSESMNEAAIRGSLTPLRVFFEGSHPDNKYLLIKAGMKATAATEFTQSPDVIADAIQSPNSAELAGRGTALYDACFLGTEQRAKEAGRRRVLLVISDGDDTSSRHSLAEVRDLMRRTDVQVFAVNLARPGIASTGVLVGSSALSNFADLTGGEFFLVRSTKEYQAAFARFAFELRHQYRIGFEPDAPEANAKWQKIKASATAPKPGGKVQKLRARSVSEYFVAPKSPAEPRRKS